MFLSFRFFKQKEEQFVLPIHVLLTACWREYLYPLSSRSLFPRPLYIDQELLRGERCSTSWFAGCALAGPFSYFVQRWRRKREIASLFFMLQKENKIMDAPGISLLEWGSGGEQRRGEALCQASEVQNP